MKKILFSLLTIGLVGGFAFTASSAFFSGSETSTENQIIAGDIELDVSTGEVDSEFSPVLINDLKPSYVRWTRHVVKNTGSNPLKLYKRLTNVQTAENEVNNSEQAYYDEHGLDNGKNDIDHYIEYDIYLGGQVEGPNANQDNSWWGGQNVGGQVVISEEAGIRISDIEDVYVYLGTLDPEGEDGDEVVVWQSYHMIDETENWAQTDTMTFDMQFLGLQLNADNPENATVGGEGRHAILLENKNYDGDWSPYIDEVWGSFSWAGDGDELDFNSTLQAHGLAANTEYSLIYYADPWPGNNPGALITEGVTDASGNLFVQDSVNLGMNLPDGADENHPDGAKIWLVPSSDYDGSSTLTAWNPENYLFEYTLMSYNDTD